MALAPIALFVYNRPDHTKMVVDALVQNELAGQSALIIFSDAAKGEADTSGVAAVREYARTITGFKSVNLISRERNYGLAESIIQGVAQVLEDHESIIVIEDDLVTAPYFLRYMNDGLQQYATEQKVISIHGYVYPVEGVLPETFFIRGADCWGWATWRRGWALFEADGAKLLEGLRTSHRTREFDFDGTYPYTQMLKGQVLGYNNSWAIRWYASAFLANKITLYPGISLVTNIGFDNSGTHTGNTAHFAGRLWKEVVHVGGVPVQENTLALALFKKFFSTWKMRAIKLSMRVTYFYKWLQKKL